MDLEKRFNRHIKLLLRRHLNVVVFLMRAFNLCFLPAKIKIRSVVMGYEFIKRSHEEYQPRYRNYKRTPLLQFKLFL